MALLRTDASQVLTWTPGMTSPRWLGAIGHVIALTYSFACPGGPDAMTCTLQIDASVRTDAMNPGRIVQVFRGSQIVWEGILQEPVPTDAGWTLAAVGAGNYGTNYDAIYTNTWPTGLPDQAINQAITRGMRWTNPGVGTPSGIWLGQEVDPGAQTITDLLNLCCTYGSLTWYVTTSAYGNILSVFPLPTTVNRLLVASTPVVRTLGGDINTVWVRYEVTADTTGSGTGAAATFSQVSATNAASIALHGPLETFFDASNSGVMSSSAATAVGTALLNRYIRASFGGPFTVGPGQLLTTGGQPVDLGADQAGTVCQLILTDFAYGGELSPAPITFLVGEYEYDDDAQAATITPFQYLDASFSSLLSAASTMLPTATTS